MRLALAGLALLCTAALCVEEIETAAHEYKIGEQIFEGYVARPKNAKDAPGLLIVPDWKGLGPFAKKQAEDAAKLGYIGFAVDMYGKGKLAKDSKEAQALAGAFYKDRSLFRTRMAAALEELKKQPAVNAAKLGAYGFCFGGTSVLELARSGAAVSGAVSFHGGLATPTPEDAKNIKARILVLHGNLDPHVPPKDVAGFMEEMNAGKVNCKFIGYPNSVHSFTNPEAGDDLSKGAAYNAEVAAQSFEEMRKFFAELFK